MRIAASYLRLCLSLLSLVLNSTASTLYSPWGGSWNEGYEATHCYPIPPNMTLCQNVGYNRMFLPNFLQHDDVKEAIHQSNIWVALVNTNCHQDLKRFLCSLYAPVCVKGHPGRKIPPCFRLCEEVKKACLPRMMYFGFKWPPIVECKQFPESDMCIPSTEPEKTKCPLCDKITTYESIASSYCLADVVLKTKIKRVESRDRAFQLDVVDRKRFLKEKGLKYADRSKLDIRVPCSCPTFNNPETRWLIMGNRNRAGQVDVTFIAQWERGDPGFRQAIRAIRRKSDQLCDRSVLKLDSNNIPNLRRDLKSEKSPSLTPENRPIVPKEGKKRRRRNRLRRKDPKRRKNRKNMLKTAPERKMTPTFYNVQPEQNSKPQINYPNRRNNRKKNRKNRKKKGKGRKDRKGKKQRGKRRRHRKEFGKNKNRGNRNKNPNNPIRMEPPKPVTNDYSPRYQFLS